MGQCCLNFSNKTNTLALETQIAQPYPQQFANKLLKDSTKVTLQKLSPKLHEKKKKITTAQIINNLNRSSDSIQQNKLIDSNLVYCYKDTSLSLQRIISKNNNFFSAFFLPYNSHGDIYLLPDDIWMAILLFLSKYIDTNAEKLRSKIVYHEGSKKLTIVQQATSLQQSIRMQKQWDFFFFQIIQQIQKNTLPGVVDEMKCEFSTTSKVHELISISIIMSSLKKYFSYERVICQCGINNVYFGGLKTDWEKMLEKLKKLSKYDVDGQLNRYIQKVSVILNQFIKTISQNIDLVWWNTIFTTEEQRMGSGSSDSTSVKGWILDFFGIYHSIDIQQIPKTAITVPIKLINKYTRMEKELELIADWVSISNFNQSIFKPDIGMCILQRSRKKLQ